jgi:hypothetical protein
MFSFQDHQPKKHIIAIESIKNLPLKTGHTDINNTRLIPKIYNKKQTMTEYSQKSFHFPYSRHLPKPFNQARVNCKVEVSEAFIESPKKNFHRSCASS